MSVLLAEDFLLLVTDDASGRLSALVASVDAGLGGANLVELDPGTPGGSLSVTVLRPVMRS